MVIVHWHWISFLLSLLLSGSLPFVRLEVDTSVRRLMDLGWKENSSSFWRATVCSKSFIVKGRSRRFGGVSKAEWTALLVTVGFNKGFLP